MNTIETNFKICPDCKYYCVITDENIFCPFCGEELIKECPKCKETIKVPHGNYCTKCGTIFPGRKTNNK